MDFTFAAFGWVLLGAAVGAAGTVAAGRRKSARANGARPTPVAELIQSHFAPTPLDEITVRERRFPTRVRADLQRAVDRLFGDETTIAYFCGAQKQYNRFEGLSLGDCLLVRGNDPVYPVPPQYEDFDIGEEQPIRCLKNGLWFLRQGDQRFVVFVAPTMRYGACGPQTSLQFQIATTNTFEGVRIAQQFFEVLEESVLRAESYRGKILSLEEPDAKYSGESSGIMVHQLRRVERDQIVLPRKTLELLERNIIQFVRQRERLSQFGQATKKGVLFYGPPGTGKTHTIHYLARALERHTTLLISAEQVGLLGEYMTLARLLQPSIVVLEDVDLIARDRESMGSPGEEVLLNKLLNEMDGLKEDAEILFVLTTNRPEMLEAALASRPGRVDQAIEFPLPDEEGREKLIRLYSGGLTLSEELVRMIVARTANVSAAFIKELMRRATQFHLQRDGTGAIEVEDLESALDEMLVDGGSLNLKLLGAERATPV